MPHLTVDYSAPLAGSFDPATLGRELHTVVEKVIAASVAVCKTRFRRAEEHVIADGAEDVDMVHVDVAVHAGRTADAKAELASSVLALLKERFRARDGHELHLSVHVSELDPAAYVAHIAPAPGR